MGKQNEKQPRLGMETCVRGCWYMEKKRKDKWTPLLRMQPGNINTMAVILLSVGQGTNGQCLNFNHGY